MRKKLLSILLIVGMMTGVVGCGNADAGKESGSAESTVDTVRLGVFTGGINQYLAIVGEEKGIFDKHGISLEITEFASGINTIDAIVTNQTDVGMVADYAGINRIGNTQENFNISILARYTSAASYSLYVNPDEVTKLEDLAGKGLAAAPGTIIDYYNAVAYEAGNVPKEEQVILNIESGQAVLGLMSSGDAVAYWATGTDAKKLQELGMKGLVTMEDLGLSVEAYYVASNSFIEEHEKTVENFLSAIKETEEWITANKEEAAKIAEDKTGVPQEQFLAILEASGLYLDFKQESIEHINKIKAWCVENGRFENDYEITDFINTTPLKNQFPENVE